MTNSSLQQFIYGYPVIADKPADAPDILAISPQLTPDTAQAIADSIPLAPPPHDQVAAYTFSVHPTDTAQRVISRTHVQVNGMPITQSILLTPDDFAHIADLNRLTALFSEQLPTYAVTNAPLDGIPLPDAMDTFNQAISDLRAFLKHHFDEQEHLFFGILGAGLSGNLTIKNFPMAIDKRLAFIRALWLAIPVVWRSRLTFSTQPIPEDSVSTRIQFVDNTTPVESPCFDWDNHVVDDAWLAHPYVTHLHALWQENKIKFYNALGELDTIATALADNALAPDDLLQQTIERHQLDLAALSGKPIAPNNILAALQSEIPMRSELRVAYLIILLEHNFQNRDTQIARVIGDEIDNDDTLDTNLKPFYETALEEQPDAFYAFVRAHLAESDDEATPDPKWRSRLQDAAAASVRIAIASQQPDTIRSWLTLIAREPLRYDLSAVLSDGISAAQPYTHDNAALAQELIGLAVKRQPDMLATLLSDDALVTALPDTVRNAIIEQDPQAIASLGIEGTESRDLFLLAVKRALDSNETIITSRIVRSLWRIHTQERTRILPPQFRPLMLMTRLAECETCFADGALTSFLTHLLSDKDSGDLLLDLLPLMASHASFIQALITALQTSRRDSESVLQLLTHMLSNDWLTAQNVVDIYIQLLNDREWDIATLPFAEQLARVMTQYPDTDAPLPVLWKLLERAAEYKNEQMLKVASRGLLKSIRAMPNETQIINSIQRLRKDASWNSAHRVSLLKWWRSYIREQNMAQLQKLDKVLDGRRTLEDLRAVVQTVIAMRRVIGDRTLAQFADAVTTTYTLLQALSDGFDTNDKLVDSITIRQEIDARTDELPAEIRPLLSTNLRELAQLVTTLSENRSKPSLIRSDDAVERQLVTGELSPQAALDVMRWLSGYLDGVQKDDTSD